MHSVCLSIKVHDACIAFVISEGRACRVKTKHDKLLQLTFSLVV